MIYESTRKMSVKEQEAYDLGYLNGKEAALRSPWVKTSDRLPTEADAGVDEEIVTIYDDGDTRMMGVDYWKYVALVPGRFPYWLPVPKLPEVGA